MITREYLICCTPITSRQNLSSNWSVKLNLANWNPSFAGIQQRSDKDFDRDSLVEVQCFGSASYPNQSTLGLLLYRFDR